MYTCIPVHLYTCTLCTPVYLYTIYICISVSMFTCSRSMHICQIIERQDMTKLAGQVIILAGHLIVPWDLPAIVVHVAQPELTVTPALICSLKNKQGQFRYSKNSL